MLKILVIGYFRQHHKEVFKMNLDNILTKTPIEKIIHNKEILNTSLANIFMEEVTEPIFIVVGMNSKRKKIIISYFFLTSLSSNLTKITRNNQYMSCFVILSYMINGI